MTTFLSPLLAFCVAFLGGQDAPASAGFEGGPRVASNVGYSSNISPDKQAVTLIFDNLYTSVEPAHKGAAGASNQTVTQSRTVTFEIPYTTDQPSVNVAIDVRGYASTDDHARVRLVAIAGDATQVVRLSGGDISKAGVPVALKGQSKQKLLASQPPPAGSYSGDFSDRLVATLRPQASKPVCQVTLLLLAEHDTDEADAGAALLVVDSLDVSFQGTGEARPKP